MDKSYINLTIEQKYGVKYTGILAKALQQEKSALEPWVTLYPGCEGKSVNIDYSSTSEMKRILSAFQDVENPRRDKYGSRQMVPVPMYAAHEFTCDAKLYSNTLKARVPGIVTEIKAEAQRKKDEVILGVHLDDQGVYRKVTTATAYENPYDEVIGGGMLGTNYVGANGKTLVDLPERQILPCDFVESGSSVETGLTVGKVREAVRRLKASKAFIPGQTTPVMALSSAQWMNLVQYFEVSHPGWGIVDMRDGRLHKLLGCQIVETELLPYLDDTTDVRCCPMWIKEHIKFGVWQDVNVRVEGPEGKRVNYGQVIAQLSYGAIRMYESSVIEIQCKE